MRPKAPSLPNITPEEIADLRARLVRAEARVQELESAETRVRELEGTMAQLKEELERARAAPPKAAHPAVLPPPAADVAPLVSVAQITPAINSAPVVEPRPSKAPGGTASIMPSMFVKGAQKKRRAVIAVTGLILTVVLGVFAVMIFSRASH